jgi:hypothetical protein
VVASNGLLTAIVLESGKLTFAIGLVLRVCRLALFRLFLAACVACVAFSERPNGKSFATRSVTESLLGRGEYVTDG